ncbi:MAG: DUF1385 domain-containing protein [Thermoleophilaceae bacterium]|nr:DUF1385 domain-containing protein [Thermoleophilaceae bacterium]
MAEARTTNGDRLRMGGMALENGLLVYGPTKWAAAVRAKNGELIVRSGKVPRLRGPLDSVPGIRGVMRLAESMIVVPLVRFKLPQARLPFESAKVAGAAAATMGISMAVRHRSKRGIGSEAALSLLGMAPALISLKAGETAQYHGVEHKAIAAYELGGDPNDPDVIEAAAKEHERCGSHLVAPMMIAGIAGDAMMRQIVAKPGPMAQVGVGLAGAATSIEMFAYAERHPDSTFTRLFRAPGFKLQEAIGTREPTPAQIEVGRAAISALLEAEGALPAGA